MASLEPKYIAAMFWNALIKPSLRNTYNNSCNYYNYSTKQHVSALFGHHQAYKTVVLVKVYSVAVKENICFTFYLLIFYYLFMFC